MNKTTKPRNDWDAIRFDYINGIPLKEMSEKYKICHTQIVRKAKQKNWGEHKSFIKKYDELATATTEMIEDHLEEYPKIKELREEINNQLLPSQIDQSNKDVAIMALYKAQLMTIQQKFAKVIEKSITQVGEILELHKDGLYTSSISGEGQKYERTTRFVNDLAPFFTENNKALGMTTAQVAIQNNINNNSSDISNIRLSADVVEASRDYQDFIKTS
jgi:hypothetical protein